MRLIDADKLPNIYTATHQETIMAFEEAPTVDAIPVDWLLQQGKVAFSSDTVEHIRYVEQYNRTILDLINKWRVENGNS